MTVGLPCIENITLCFVCLTLPFYGLAADRQEYCFAKLNWIELSSNTLDSGTKLFCLQILLSRPENAWDIETLSKQWRRLQGDFMNIDRLSLMLQCFDLETVINSVDLKLDYYSLPRNRQQCNHSTLPQCWSCNSSQLWLQDVLYSFNLQLLCFHCQLLQICRCNLMKPLYFSNWG